MAKNFTFNPDLDLNNIDKIKNISNLSFSSLINVFKNSQQSIKVYERLIHSKIPDKKKQEKENRRKERLKEMYKVYINSLDITLSGFKPSKPAYIQSETQLKSLISHQSSVLENFKNMFKEETVSAQPIIPSIYKNILIFKIIALFKPPSKHFLPESTKFSICSIYFHDENIALKTKNNLAKEIEWKLTEFRNKSSLNSLISKRKTFDNSYKKVEKKIIQNLEEIVKSRKKEDSILEISNKNKACEFIEGETVQAVSLVKVILDCQKTLRNLTTIANEEETIEANWSPAKRHANVNRLGFFHKAYEHY